ncbi:sulfite exporter TauE/SafE family protein [Roseomonas sp. SSH11]|uniref:Probable membrane transporter protein n=1 Tax=Pararoseomonas baculiformis TaxID=2820812 RepID=A0ABS4ADT5_9PROT|nr:sulfite exporter TauE/SafE family protein [Pararoseomonas baculiformis]MBP0445167.1 sulfite exporter TauE/SafE family protein [Pararoseomonas baculiformis]
MDPALIAAIAAVFTLAGFVKGVIGLGLPTVAMGVLGSLMAPAAAAALLVFPSVVTNIWQMAGGPGLPALLRRLWPMLAGVCLGSWAGAGLLTGDNTRAAMAGLGAALLAYAAIGLLPWKLPRIPPRHEGWAGPLTGAATGLVTGATGVFVIPAVPYLGALGLTRDELVQALGLSFTVSTLALAVALGGAGVFNADLAWGSLVALIPALVGMWLGTALRRRVSPEAFRRWFFLGLLVLGVQLVARGLG